MSKEIGKFRENLDLYKKAVNVQFLSTNSKKNAG